MIALIDGDILTYSVGFAAEERYYEATDEAGETRIVSPIEVTKLKKVYPGEYTYEPKVEPVSKAMAKKYLRYKIQDILNKVRTDKYEVYITDKNLSKNFRSHITGNLQYKGNRKTSAFSKPFHYGLIRNTLRNTYGATRVSGIEADDALGIRQMELNAQGIASVIVSIDKDMWQIPGFHCNLNTGKWMIAGDPGRLWIDNSYTKPMLKGHGIKWLYAQMLLGDVIDNIHGVKGYGDMKTFKYLDRYNTQEDLHSAVNALYLKQGYTQEQFDGTLRLLTILREPLVCATKQDLNTK